MSVQSSKITGACIQCFFHFSGISFLYFTKALVHDRLKVSGNWPLLCILSVRITTIWIFVSTRISLIIKRKFKSLPWQVIYLNLKKEIWSIVFFHILSLFTSSLLNKAKLLLISVVYKLAEIKIYSYYKALASTFKRKTYLK